MAEKKSSKQHKHPQYEGILLRTSSFRDIPLYMLPLPEIVRGFSAKEAEREKGSKPDEVTTCHISRMVNELSSSVKLYAISHGVNISTLTRCISLHVISWYQAKLNLDKIAGEWLEVYKEAKKGHSDIRKQMEQITFKPIVPLESGNNWWDIPNFVLYHLNAWRQPLGTSVYDLLTTGAAWSLTTTLRDDSTERLKSQGWDDEENIEQYFMPEVRHMIKTLSYRKIELEGFKAKIDIDNNYKDEPPTVNGAL